MWWTKQLPVNNPGSPEFLGCCRHPWLSRNSTFAGWCRKQTLPFFFLTSTTSLAKGTVGWPYSSNINHFLRVVSYLVIQPGWHPAIAFLNWPAKVIICFMIEVHPRTRSSLAKMSAYSLRILWASHWSSGSHSVYPKRFTFPRTSGSRVGTSNWEDPGVSQVTYTHTCR